MFGAPAEEEVARQQALWEKSPKTSLPDPRIDPDAYVRAVQKRNFREEQATTLAELQVTYTKAAESVVHVRALKKDVSGSEFRCALNLIEIDVACIQRILSEIPTYMSLQELRKSAATAQKHARDLPLHISRALEMAQIERAQKPTPPVPEPPPALGKCAWKDCTNPHKEASAYCSVECRKKVARWNYDQRQKSGVIQVKPVKPVEIKPVKPVKKPVKKPVEKTAPVLSTKTIDAMSLNDLRKYATHVLKVERASKIPGGKPVLLDICRKVMCSP